MSLLGFITGGAGDAMQGNAQQAFRDREIRRQNEVNDQRSAQDFANQQSRDAQQRAHDKEMAELTAKRAQELEAQRQKNHTKNEADRASSAQLTNRAKAMFDRINTLTDAATKAQNEPPPFGVDPAAWQKQQQKLAHQYLSQAYQLAYDNNQSLVDNGFGGQLNWLARQIGVPLGQESGGVGQGDAQTPGGLAFQPPPRPSNKPLTEKEKKQSANLKTGGDEVVNAFSSPAADRGLLNYISQLSR